MKVNVCKIILLDTTFALQTPTCIVSTKCECLGFIC